MIEHERRNNAMAAAKAMLAEQRKKEKTDRIKAEKKASLDEFMRKKKIRTEWRNLQD